MNITPPPPPPVIVVPPLPPTVEDVNIAPSHREVSVDVECYYNYFLVQVLDIHTDELIHTTEMYNDKMISGGMEELHDMLSRNTIITFNGIGYDLIIITAFINGANNYQMKTVSDRIIKDRLKYWNFERDYNVRIPKYDHVDVQELTPGAHSLKIYGARLRCAKLQELPVGESDLIMPHQLPIQQNYCRNDCFVTGEIYKHLHNQIELRKRMSDEYGIDLRSKSDAQVAEAIFVKKAAEKHIKLTKPNMKTHSREFVYIPPPFIKFNTNRMNELLALCSSLTYRLSDKHKIMPPKEFGIVRFYSDEDKGHLLEKQIADALVEREKISTAIDLPELNAILKGKVKELGSSSAEVKEFRKSINTIKKDSGYNAANTQLSSLRKNQKELTIREYTMQIGGLHSKHDAGTYYSDDEYQVFEIDVSSFYPNIIIQAGLYIKSMGKEVFQSIYQSLIDIKNNSSAELKILQAKDNITDQDKERIEILADTIYAIKIAINGSYGKLSSHYSKLYSPDMLIGTTITGQLSLLMLLEIFHANGIHVLSANTDGINVRVHKSQREFVDTVVDDWCTNTGFVMDYNYYKSIHYRDVNNYFAHYDSGKVKGIGIFASENLRISPEYFIVRDACFEFVKNGTPIEETINDCEDIHAFVNLRKCSDGAIKDGEDVGKVLRWYHSITSSTAIHSSSSGNTVAGSKNSTLIMDYPDEIPYDLDRQFYIHKAYKTLAVTHLLNDDLDYLMHEGSDQILACKRGEHDEAIAQGQLDRIDKDLFFEKIGITTKDRRDYGLPKQSA